MLDIHQFVYGGDNYGVLIHDEARAETALIDAGDSEAALAALAETGWNLTQIWITHHHWDHIDGLADIVSKTGATVYGPDGLKGVDQGKGDGDSFALGASEVRVIATPGHTLDMLNFHLPVEKLLFTGDTLFAMGCGRLFEGDAAMMWNSLTKLMALGDDTVIYCGHEYTAANAKFALSIDPENKALQSRADAVRELREAGQPTVPTMMALEKATNPFLRPHDPDIQMHLGMLANRTDNDHEAAVFAEIRRRKDNF
jgi:hydroxyacylglutathione hydrolase